MAQVRRHLTRKPHSMFVKLCPTCNIDILDKDTFELSHDNMCCTPQKQSKGAEQEIQWYALYGQIELLVKSRDGSQRMLHVTLRRWNQPVLTIHVSR